MSQLVLMGAGVGDSTDGIGKHDSTLTDDHFWIQKVQDYYINHLIRSTLDITSFVSDIEQKKYIVNLTDNNLSIKNLTSKHSNLRVFLYDILGREVLSNKAIKIENNERVSILTHNSITNNIYICLLLDEYNQVFRYKIIKN